MIHQPMNNSRNMVEIQTQVWKTPFDSSFRVTFVAEVLDQANAFTPRYGIFKKNQAIFNFPKTKHVVFCFFLNHFEIGCFK